MSFISRTAAFWASQLLRREAPMFDSRAEAEAGAVLPWVNNIRVRKGKFILHYLRNNGSLFPVSLFPALTLGDGSTWVPANKITPDHWVYNAIQGVTPTAWAQEMAVHFAIEHVPYVGVDRQASPTVEYLPGQTYYNEAKVRWDAQQGVNLVGNKAEIQSDIDDFLFRIGNDSIFDSPDCAGSQTRYGGQISGLLFNSTNFAAANSGALQLGKTWELNIDDCVFRDFNVGIDALATGRVLITDSVFRIRQRNSVNTAAFLRARSVYDSSVPRSVGTGMRLSRCEMDGPQGTPSESSRLQAAILIHSMDSFYYADNHIRSCKHHIRIEPTGAANNYRDNEFTDLMSGGCNYYDNSGTGENIFVTGTVAYDDVPGNSERAKGLLTRIRTAQSDKFRGGSAAPSGIRVAVADGSVNAGDYYLNRGPIDVEVSGEFGQHTKTHVAMSGVPAGMIPVSLRMCDVTSWQGNTAGDAEPVVLLQQGGTALVQGVQVMGVREPGSNLIAYNGLGAPAGGGWGITVDGVEALQSAYTGTNPVSLANMTNCYSFVAGVAEKSDFSQKAARRYSATLSGEGPIIAHQFTVPAPTQTVDPTPATSVIRSIRHTAVCDSVAGGAGRYARIIEDILARRTGGNTTVAVRTNVANNRSAGWANNQYPASLVPLFGEDWTTTTAITAGTVRVEDGRVYLAVKGGTTGATGPTSTSGLEVDGTVTWVYAGPETTNTFVAVLSGQAGYDLRFAGEVEMLGV